MCDQKKEGEDEWLENMREMIADLDCFGQEYSEHFCAHEVCVHAITFFISKLFGLCDTKEQVKKVVLDAYKIADKIRDEELEKELKEIS